MILVLFMTFSLFSQDFASLLLDKIEAKKAEEANKSELLKALEKNKKLDVEIEGLVSFDGFKLNSDGTLFVPELISEKFSIVATEETELLKERLLYSNCEKYKVSFLLTNIKPKTYSIIKIDGIETVDECKERLIEEERLAKIEADRIAEENRKKLEIGLPIYKKHLAKAKEYENQEKWCYALDSYYDALGVDIDYSNKIEAYKGFIALKKAIMAGSPGLNNYDMFSIHDKWKKLLIEAEQYGSSFNPYEITIGNLTQAELNYENKTASYTASVSYEFSNRYKNTISIIEEGYKKAYKDDWNDMPEIWPKYSASYKNNDVYYIDGVGVFHYEETYVRARQIINNEYYINSFASVFDRWTHKDRKEVSTFIDCKFAIVDREGKELIKSKRCLLGAEDKIQFENVTPEIMKKISNDEISVKPIEYYLQYGKYNLYDDIGGRAFIKKCSEKKLPIEKSIYKSLSNNKDEQYEIIKYSLIECQRLVFEEYKKNNEIEMVTLSEIGIMMGTTEVTQDLYTMVMHENPSYFKEGNNPVEMVSYYDAIYFCNKLSDLEGLECVYSVKGETEVENWDYKPHAGSYINFETNDKANGYRLPTYKEWQSVNTTIPNSEINDYAFFEENSESKTHPVGQKKANLYGLYDISGNVWEWNQKYRIITGGCWNNTSNYAGKDLEIYENTYRSDKIGFRLVRNIQ